MKKVSLKAHVHYRFDNIMSRGTISLVIWLAFLTAITVFVIALVAFTSGVSPVSPDGYTRTFGETLWISLTETLNPAQISTDQGQPFFLLLMLVAGACGIFIFSALISILTSGLENRFAELRKGRSMVIEKDHIVILGWSSQIFEILSELIIAHRDRAKSCIVILAPKDKVEMEEEIRRTGLNCRHTRVVCRTGDCTELAIWISST